MPALAQTKPWWVSVISTPRSARSTSRLSERISSTSAGSLPSLSASSRASAPGSTSASAAPSLGLGDDLLRDDDDVAVLAAPAPRGDQLAELHPSRTSGRPCDGDDPQLAERSALDSYPQRLGGPRARRASAGLASSRVQGDDVGGGVEVEFDRGQLLDPERDPRRRAPPRRGGRGCPRRRRGRSRRAGQHQRVGAGAVAVGDDRRRSARGRRSAAGRARAGRAAGSRRRAATTRSAPSASAAGDPRPAPPATCPRPRGRGPPRRPPPRPAPGRSGRR